MAAPPPTFLESLESFSPWGSRSATPRATGGRERTASAATPPDGEGEGARLQEQKKGADYRVSHRYRIPPRDIPPDCPPLLVRWFYATDVIKRRPHALYGVREAEKVPKEKAADPKKYAPFSARDSHSIELAFQKLADDADAAAGRGASEAGKTNRQPSDTERAIEESRGSDGAGSIGGKLNTSMHEENPFEEPSIKVPVNDDFLFDVDVDARELGPAYWLGPIYDVRRGSWFYAEGSSIRACDENLAAQLEEGYIKARPWRNEPLPTARSASGTRSRPASWMFGDGKAKPPSSSDNASGADAVAEGAKTSANRTGLLLEAVPVAKAELQTQRLFGTHMNSVVTYQDSTTAWLLTDDFLSRMSSTVYSRFAGGGHLGGIKLVRGYTEPGKAKPKGDANWSPAPSEDQDRGRSRPAHRKSLSAPDLSNKESETVEGEDETPEEAEQEPQSTRQVIERQISQLSGLVGSSNKAAEAAAQEEAARRKEEEEIREDYQDEGDAEQDREIEHLVLVAHGIGQRLGLKMESLNFIHDVNVFRKALKGIYEKSPDLQALNAEIDSLPKNCRIQVLPVVWRHLLDFPHQSFKENKEKDLSDATKFGEELGYPSMKDITVEGIAPIRNLVEDLFLDILLYQSAYRDRIVQILQKECNRIYNLFCQRNPNFHGKVSLVGHSLGSALFFDLLCHQKDTGSDAGRRGRGFWWQRSAPKKPPGDPADRLQLDFAVEDFYALGSPIGLFQMIKGKSVSARGISITSSSAEDALGTPSNDPGDNSSTSSPQCAQIYNIFHPTDPVAYRIEPLISPAMKELKPQPLPYVKKGMFDMPGQGLSGIGMRVGQSVSGLWSSMTTGVASSLLNRSLGIQPVAHSSEGGGKGFQLLNLTGYTSSNHQQSGTDGSSEPLQSSDVLEHPPTLIDAKLDTLYAGFQHRRSHRRPTDEGSGSGPGDASDGWNETEKREKQLRQEEAKVRALNANGRVDYSIQEGVFDISLIGSIASHLSYWGDEDVNHFIVSQLLSRQRVVKRDD